MVFKNQHELRVTIARLFLDKLQLADNHSVIVTWSVGQMRPLPAPLARFSCVCVGGGRTRLDAHSEIT